MNPGRLNTKITIQSAALAPDALGQRIETWTTEANIRGALLDPPKGDEPLIASGQQKHHSDIRRYRIRRRPSLTNDHRFKIGGDIFQILHIADADLLKINSRKYLHITISRIETE